MVSEDELARIRPLLFGLIDESRIRRVDIPRVPREVIDGFLSLTDVSSTVSDALDEIGAGHVISGSGLAARTGSARMAGQAITIRYTREEGSAGALAARNERARLADRDLYALAEPGDVAVFDCSGVSDASVMGGLSATWAHHRRLAGCVVAGSIRDLDSIRMLGLPVWSCEVTPRTGKHRMQAWEINAPVAVCGCLVEPGDVIAADTTGVCVVPLKHAERVLEISEAAERAEATVIAAMTSGQAPRDLATLHPVDRW